MAINLADKYSQKVAERFSLKSVTDAHVGRDYDFDGVNTIKIYSVDTVPLVDYTRSGSARFGALTELGDTIQTHVITQDKAFAFTIDQGNAKQQFNIKQATKCLKREIDEVVTPTVDKYRLEAWAAGAGTTQAVTAPTKANVLETILTASLAMNELLVPKAGRAVFISEKIYLLCKLADQIVGIDKLGTKALVNGSVGMLDGMNIIPVPSSYFPDGVYFIVKYKGSSVDPVQLTDYTVHKRPPGIGGDLVEGRIIYDSFVNETRKNGIYVATA